MCFVVYDVNNLWNQRFQVDTHILFPIIWNNEREKKKEKNLIQYTIRKVANMEKKKKKKRLGVRIWITLLIHSIVDAIFV